MAQILGQPLPGPGRRARAVRSRGMHIAVPILREGNLLGVVRVSLSLDDLEEELRGFRSLLLGTVLLTTLLAVAVTLTMTGSVTGPIREVTEVARRMAGGDLARRVVSHPDNEMGGLVVSFNTMAARIQEMMAELEGERGKMARVFAQMADGLVVSDAEGRIVMMNPAAERILGAPAGDCLGRPLAEAVPLPELAGLAAAARESGQEQRAEIHRRRPVEQMLEAYAAPVALLTYAAGVPPGGAPPSGAPQAYRSKPSDEEPTAAACAEGPPGAMLVLHDRTEVYRTERMRRELVDNASHELRTPVAALKMMAETLLEGAQDDPEVRGRFIGLMAHEADRLSDLARDLLDLSQMEAGEWPMKIRSFALSEVVDQVLDKCSPAARERRQELAAQCPPEAAVLADRVAMAQILTNLVENAIKYTPEGGRVAVVVEPLPAHVRIRVRDTGIGIPAEHLERIFERFYRVDKARSRALGGSGLGLAIVAHLVEVQGGTITVESTPGQGSTFTVELPA